MSGDRNELLKLYEGSCNEVHRFYEAHTKRMEWLISIISAIGAGTITGILNSSKWYQFLALAVGGLVIVRVSIIARAAVKSERQYFLEFVSIRSKYEQMLGLAAGNFAASVSVDAYWRNDAVMPARYLRSRRSTTSAEEWVEQQLSEQAPQLWTNRMFALTEGIGSGLICLCILLSLVNGFDIGATSKRAASPTERPLISVPQK